MKKTMRVGRVEDGDVFVQVEHDGRRLSLHGVVGPKANGDCSGSCGQIVDTLRGMTAGAKFAPGWGVKSCARLVELWDRWHLNDMRPGCEHQEAEKRAHPLPVLTVEKISVFPKLYALEKEQKRAATAEEAAAVARQIFEIDAIFAAAVGPRAGRARGRHLWTPEQAAALEGNIQIKTEEKNAGWVYPEEHPDGWLCKPCAVCGYEYGHGWQFEEVPAAVLEELEAFPDADITPAWC